MNRLFSKVGAISINEAVPVVPHSPMVLELPGRPVQLRVPRPDRLLAGMAALLVAMLLAGCGGTATGVAAPVAGLPIGATGEENSESAALTATDVNAWLDGLMPAALETGGIAGGIVSVVKDGEVLTARGFGSSDLGAEAEGRTSPVDPDQTLFRPGSVSKVFTATAVMQLVEQGKVDLDADISAYLDFEIPREFDTPLTLRHLLTHTAGFEERIRGMFGPEGGKADLQGLLTNDPPPEQIYEPGTTPAYSNYGYGLAGYIVQRVSGVPFEQYVQDNILNPVGMTSSTFAQPLPEDLAGRVSKAYPDDSQPPMPFETINPAPAGALTSSAPDMARFMLAQLGELPKDQAVLDPDTLELMHQPALDADSLGSRAEGTRMALGLFDESRNGHRILGHGGDTNVFHSHMRLYPDDGVGIFVSLNSTGPNGVETLAIRSELMDGFSDRYFPGTDEPVVEASAKKHAAVAEGTYASSRTMQSTFLSAFSVMGQTQIAAQKDGTITITPGPGSPDPAVYREIEPWVWQEVGGQGTIAMQTKDGEVVAIGHDSAFTLLPVSTSQTQAVALSILGASGLVLVISLLALPLGALARRRYGAASPLGRPGQLARVLTRLGSLSALVAFAGWLGVVMTAVGSQDVPDVVLRTVQLLQLLGVLAIVPAAVVVIDTIRRRLSPWRIAAAVLVSLALAGAGWFALTFRLLAPSVSY